MGDGAPSMHLVVVDARAELEKSPAACLQTRCKRVRQTSKRLPAASRPGSRCETVAIVSQRSEPSSATTSKRVSQPRSRAPGSSPEARARSFAFRIRRRWCPGSSETVPDPRRGPQRRRLPREPHRALQQLHASRTADPCTDERVGRSRIREGKGHLLGVDWTVQLVPFQRSANTPNQAGTTSIG